MLKRKLAKEKRLQLLFNGHFNEESITRRFRNSFATNYANTSTVFHIFTIIRLAITAKVVLNNMSLGLGHKFKQFIYCGLTVISTSLCFIMNDNNNTTLELQVSGAPE